MGSLLIHSMAEFRELILQALEVVGAKSVVEIGSEAGTMTQQLIDYTERVGGSLTSVDPSPGPEAERLFAGAQHARLIRDVGVSAIPALAADAWLVDGDHNWWTVLNESERIWERVNHTQGHFLVFYHDVSWPWARRDLYYAPDRIPKEHVQPHAWDRGVALDVPGVVVGGFRGEGGWAAALKEGGPRNGVLTAIEDFVKGKEQRLGWAQIPAVFGLGILFDRQAPWAGDLARFLMPYHMNPLLARLERNRLECYLKVVALQDRPHEPVR